MKKKPKKHFKKINKKELKNVKGGAINLNSSRSNRTLNDLEVENHNSSRINKIIFP